MEGQHMKQGMVCTASVRSTSLSTTPLRLSHWRSFPVDTFVGLTLAISKNGFSR